MFRFQLRTAILLALLSGAAALAHQLIWMRRMVDVLGAHSNTFAWVIGAFFLGLALGGWMASRRLPSPRNAWAAVAFAELAVSVLAGFILFSANAGHALYQNYPSGPGFKLLVVLLLITPPAVAMGLALPWMVNALARSSEFRAVHTVQLYAVNTLGGGLGIALVLFWALPTLGLTGAGLIAIGLNALVAAAAIALHYRSGANATSVRRAVVVGEAALSRRSCVLAFASGFLVLGMEVVLHHQLTQVSVNSLVASGTVLSLVLLSLALSATVVAFDRFLDLRIALMLSVVLCALEPFLLSIVRPDLQVLPFGLLPLAYTWEMCKLSFITVCPLLLATGMIFPLLLRSCTTRQVGVLLAWNGIGGLLGAQLSDSWVAPHLGLWTSMTLFAAGYLVLWAGDGQTFNRNTKIITASATLVVALSAYLTRGLPQATLLKTDRMAAIAVGREGVVATIQAGNDWWILFNNSYTLGGSLAQFNQERQAHLPLLLHGDAKSVACLGVGTGSTAAGAALHPGVEHVDAIEVSSLVLRQAAEFFGPYNRNVFHNQRVRFIQEDARWIIAHQREAYDVVVGDLFVPWRTGEARLLTLEQFEMVRRSLKPGGLFCQWLPMYQLTRPQFEAIARTFEQVFPDVFVIRGDFYLDEPILGLVGGRNLETQDWTRTKIACDRLRASGTVTDPIVRHVEGVATVIVGRLAIPDDGRLHTLANGWLEWDAAQNVLGLREPWFTGLDYARYVGEAQASARAMMPGWIGVSQESSRFFLKLQIALMLDAPGAGALLSQFKDHLPVALREDRSADWDHWPMRGKSPKRSQ